MLKVENGALADVEQGDLRMNELTPFNMALHPGDHTLVIGTGSAGLTVLNISQQTSSPPTLSLAPGALAIQCAYNATINHIAFFQNKSFAIAHAPCCFLDLT